MGADNTDTPGNYATRKNRGLNVFANYIIYSLFSSFLLFSPVKLTAQNDSQNLEYKIKAAYLYNFTKFIIWPEELFISTQKTTFNICILEYNPFGHALELLGHKMVNGLKLVTEISESAVELDHCQIVYFPRSMEKKYVVIINQLAKKNILTVSDIVGFVNNGGHIGLDTIKGKVRFDINLAATKSCGLKISAKLLELAMTVIE
ncbi:MAG TPA: YfiR family protein [Gammaproteobacteria bacterium]